LPLFQAAEQSNLFVSFIWLLVVLTFVTIQVLFRAFVLSVQFYCLTAFWVATPPPTALF